MPTEHTAKVDVERIRMVSTPAGDKLSEGEEKVLGALRTYPEGRTRKDLAFLTGYSRRASTIDVIISGMRKKGLLEPGTGAAGSLAKLTALGLQLAGGVEERPTGMALLDHWKAHKKVGEGGRKVLDVFVKTYPDNLTRDELCDLTGYSPGASTIDVILSNLRKLGLVEKRERRLADNFAGEIGVAA